MLTSRQDAIYSSNFLSRHGREPTCACESAGRARRSRRPAPTPRIRGHEVAPVHLCHREGAATMACRRAARRPAPLARGRRVPRVLHPEGLSACRQHLVSFRRTSAIRDSNTNTYGAPTRGIARDTSVYHDPDAFIPERFLTADGELDLDVRDPATFSFGYGRRYVNSYSPSSFWSLSEADRHGQSHQDLSRTALRRFGAVHGRRHRPAHALNHCAAWQRCQTDPP